MGAGGAGMWGPSHQQGGLGERSLVTCMTIFFLKIFYLVIFFSLWKKNSFVRQFRLWKHFLHLFFLESTETYVKKIQLIWEKISPQQKKEERNFLFKKSLKS